jgi:hypothetical protein
MHSTYGLSPGNLNLTFPYYYVPQVVPLPLA